MRGSRLAVVFSVAMLLLCGAAGSGIADEAPAVDLKAAIEKLGGAPCATGSLTCVSIEVPLDHRANDPSKNLKLGFAVSFASEQSKGLLFYAVGGPGGSGLGVADDYLSAFDERLTQNMDIVFFDQRGVGAEHGIECPIAQGAFDMRRFVRRCARRRHRDRQAFRDRLHGGAEVEGTPAVRGYRAGHPRHGDFREAIGAPKVWIYGESYGTQFAQQYATAFPNAINGVMSMAWLICR